MSAGQLKSWSNHKTLIFQKVTSSMVLPNAMLGLISAASRMLHVTRAPSDNGIMRVFILTYLSICTNNFCTQFAPST